MKTVIATNVGKADRTVRIVAAAVLLGLFAADLAGAWALLGLVPLITGILRYCPLYSLLGLRTDHGRGHRLP